MEKLTEKEKMNTAEVIAELVALKEFFDELTNATPVCIEYAIDELKRLEVEAIPIEWMEQWLKKQNYGRRNGKVFIATVLNSMIDDWREKKDDPLTEASVPIEFIKTEIQDNPHTLYAGCLHTLLREWEKRKEE